MVMTNDCKMVVFSDKAYNAIIRETFEWDPVETGGILLGHILDNGCWIVMEVLPPGYSEGREGDNVHHEMGYFEYNQRFVNYLANSVATQYKIPLELLGLWHRHPGSMDYFSTTDDGTNKTFAALHPNGAISGLVNVDPKLRLTMFYISHHDTGMGRPHYQNVDVEVGSDLIPEEYFEMQYYGGENDELHPYSPRQRQGNERQTRNEEDNRRESGDININRIINEQLGHSDTDHQHYGEEDSHNGDAPNWYYQLTKVFDLLKKNKLIGCLFSILIIAAFCFSIKMFWNGVKSIWPDKPDNPTPPQGLVNNNQEDKEIKVVDEHMVLRDQTPKKNITNPQTDSNIEWKSSDENVVTVNKDGFLQAVADGKTVVKAVYGKHKLECHIQVLLNENNPKIEIDNGQYSDACDLISGTKYELGVRKIGTVNDDEIKWVSKDSNIATVDSKGKVTAKDPGKTTICLCLGTNIEDEITINVKKKQK